MEDSRIDGLARVLASHGTRRSFTRLALGLGFASGLVTAGGDTLDAARRRKRRRRRKKNCRPRSIAKICASACGQVRNRKTCGKTVDCGPCTPLDACANCADGQRCQNGTCRSCTVMCPSGQSPQACGDTLRAALADTSLSAITICPGTYAGGFTIDREITLLGSGQGTDPATSTILSGSQEDRVVWITTDAGAVRMENLRITDGSVTNGEGAGILHQGASLTMTGCTVSGNTGANLDGVGIYSLSPLTMTHCEISDNTCAEGDEPLGGGLFVQGPTTLASCLITGNQTTAGIGGGMFVGPTTVSLTGQTLVTGNSATDAGGIFVDEGGSLTIGGSCRVTHNMAPNLVGGIVNKGGVALQGSSPGDIVVDNCYLNCEDVTGCTNDQTDCPGG